MTFEQRAAPVPVPTSFLSDRAAGALVCAAVGDAIGGATEGYLPGQIKERWGGFVEGVVRPYFGDDWPTARPISPLHKGDGHITDDTIMTHLLVRAYTKLGRHLGAFDMSDHLVPMIVDDRIWVPETEREEVPFHRLFVAEKYMVLRLRWGNIDPREAGVGNAVNCGAAMYMSPVGIVNAGDPHGAYAEAIDLSGAHQHSFGREAAGVMAAAVAEAVSPRATVDSVLGTAIDAARDGTKPAIEAVLEAASTVSEWREAVESGVLRDAIRPFDTVADTYREPGLGARRASRLHAIEELPIALAMLALSGGDVRAAILGGTNYGRDSDSIASMAGALAGAIGGTAAVPDDWADQVQTASRTDLWSPAFELAAVAAEIRASDMERCRAHIAISAEIFG